MTAPERRQLQPRSIMSMVRIGMLLGTLLFGAIVWFTLRRHGGLGIAVAPGRLRTLRNVSIAIWVVASVALGSLALLRGRVINEARERALTVVSWAVGEMVALIGGLFYLASGQPRFYTLGLLFFVVALMVTPVRPVE